MYDVDYVLPVATRAVLFEQRRDCFTCRFDVDGFQMALGVSFCCFGLVVSTHVDSH